MKPKLTARILLFTLILVFLITPIVCAQEDKIGVNREDGTGIWTNPGMECLTLLMMNSMHLV